MSRVGIVWGNGARGKLPPDRAHAEISAGNAVLDEKDEAGGTSYDTWLRKARIKREEPPPTGYRVQRSGGWWKLMGPEGQIGAAQRSREDAVALIPEEEEDAGKEPEGRDAQDS